MIELTPEQVAVLERLRARGFAFATFPLYSNKIGVRKGNCAALLDPVPGHGLRVFGEPCYLVEGKLSVPVTRGNQKFFVWKKNQVPATPERLEELGKFARELNELLAPRELSDAIRPR